MSSKKRRTYSSKSADSAEVKSNKSLKTAEKLPFINVYEPPKNEPEEKIRKKTLFLYLGLCFIIPFIIMGICFAVKGVFPFGDRSVLYSDLKAQYYPFLNEFQTKLQQGGSLLWTWNSGMGSNFIAMIGYYLSSPLNLLTALVPSDWLLPAIAVLIMTKLSLASTFCGVFILNVFKRCDFSLVAFGCCYGFCSFMMGYYWNIIWFDSVAILPLVALGVYKLVYEGKYKLYVIALAVGMIASYYIGYMLCVFTFIWFFMLWLKYPKCKEKKKRFIGSFITIGCLSLIAIALSAFIILPSYLQLQHTVASNDSFPSKLEFYNSFFDILGNTLGFHKPTTMVGLPNTYCGIISVCLLFIFIRSKKVRTAEKIVDISFLVFLILSLNTNILDFIWHGLHFPNQIPYRFAFIFAFFLVILAYRAFSLLQYLEKSDIVALIIGSLAMLVCGVISLANEDVKLDLTGIALSALAMVIYTVIIILYEEKKLNLKLASAIMCVFVIAEMGANCYIGVDTVGTSDMNYPANLKEEEFLLDYIDEANKDNPDFFRTEHTDISSKNDGFYYGYKGIGQFSSTCDTKLISWTAKVGLISKRSSWQFTQTSPLITSMLNVKYIIARDGFTAEDKTLTKVTEKDGVELNEYEYYLPISFMTDSGFKEYRTGKYAYVFDVQNEMFKSATGMDENIFDEFAPDDVSVSSGKVEKLEKTGEYRCDANSTSDHISFTYTVPKDGAVYAYANFRDCAKSITFRNKSYERSVDIDARRYVFPVGQYKAGDKITFDSKLSVSPQGTVRLYVATFDENIFKQGYDLLNDETLNVTKYTDTSIEGTITAKKDGVMYSSILNEGGWKVYVDGKEAEVFDLMGAFIGIELDEGEHTIRFEYMPEGFMVGLGISSGALLIFIALCIVDFILEKKKKSKESQLKDEEVSVK